MDELVQLEDVYEVFQLDDVSEVIELEASCNIVFISKNPNKMPKGFISKQFLFLAFTTN